MSLRVTKPEFNIREKLNELDRPIGVQGNSILQSNTTAESFSKIQAGRRNLVINGNMSIAQRGTSTTGITGDTFGACDRWEVDLGSAGTWTMEQVGDAPYNTGFTHCTSLSCTASHAVASGGKISLRQKIEACNIKGLMGGTPSAKPLTISFWVKSNEPGKYHVVFYRPRTGTDSSRIGISYTIEQSEVWEFKTITFPPDTLNGYGTSENSTGLEIHFFLASDDSTYGAEQYGHWRTSNASLAKGQTNLAAATGNYWRVTGVQLEIGNEHTEFEDRSHIEELTHCMRYYEGIKMGTGTALFRTYTNTAGSPTNVSNVEYNFKVEKRATPTWTVEGNASWHPSGTSGMSAYPSTSTCLFQRNDTTHQFLADGAGDLCGSFSCEL